MKFSLIGTGFIMPRHVEAIYFIGGKILDVANTTHGEEAWRDMVKKTDADCIVILTPNDLHFPMAMAASEEGKIVLCEKPLTIRCEDARALAAKPNIFTVLQLRHHPLVEKVRGELDPAKTYEIEMDISVHRDEHYYKSWKGQPKRSGGILFNLGIHYFDLLLYLFGRPGEIKTLALDEKVGSGSIRGQNYTCRWRVSSDEARDNQRRVFKINGVAYNFSSKDNLSYENLHREVYKDLIDGKGVTPADELLSIEFVEQLYKTAPSR